MQEEIQKRLNALVSEGNTIISGIPYDHDGSIYFWVPDGQVTSVQAWVTSASNAINIVVPHNNPIREHLSMLLEDQHYKNGSGIPSHFLQKLLGLLQGTLVEFQSGLLKDFQYIVFAEAFDNFLDHAEQFHKGNKKVEASILASIILEDSLKRIARKNSIDPKGQALEELIDNLIKNNIFTPVKGKRIKGLCGVRNHALHAEWEEFDIKDVGLLIGGLKDLIEEFL